MSDIYSQLANERRAARRRELYRTDPIWQLTKRKANREDRLRRKLRSAD